MRRWFAGFLAILILMGPVLSLGADAVEIEHASYSDTVPETTAETTEAATEATEAALAATEHIPEDTTAPTEEAVNSTEAADATVPTTETNPVETVSATVSTTPTETVPETVSETHPATEETQSPETMEATAATEETQPAEEEPPKKSLWEMLLEFLGLMEEDGALESLSLSDAQGKALALTPEFTPNCHTYGAQVPTSGELTLTLEPGTDYQVYVNGTVLEENRYVFTPQWDSQNLYQLELNLFGKGLYDEDNYTLSLVLTPRAQSIEVTQLPEKTEYQSGEAFDPTGLEVKVTLSDGTAFVPKTEELTFSPAEELTAGDTAVTVQYEDASAQIEIQVSGLEGDGSKGNPYLLKTQEDLFLLDQWVTEGNDQKDLYFNLTQDIEITEPWDGIGDENNPFSGTFNGKGFQITIPEGGKALFSRTREANIRNLKVYGPRIEDYGLVSHYVVDYSTKHYVTFRNVTLVSGTQTLYSGFIGGYASGQDAVDIISCTVEPGVIIGYDKSQSRIGSFGGEFNGTIQDSTSAATVYGVNYVGGLVGNKGQSMGGFTVTDSSFTGTVSATGKCVGGIVGGGYGGGSKYGLATAPNTKGVVIKDCAVSGSVTGSVGVGGIFGAENCAQQFWDNGICEIQGNRFTGSVHGSKFVGGVIGFMQSLNKYASISGNYYKNAAKGIGAVAHVDTSNENLPNGFHGDTYYYNTAKYVSDGQGGVKSYDDKINCVPLKLYIDLPTIGSSDTGTTRAVSKPALNRTDDPLGADAQNLCHTDTGGVTESRVTGLKISGSYKTEYIQGEALDLTGLILTATWSTGKTTQVNLDEVTVSGDTSNPGTQTVTLTYKGVDARFTVTVTPKSTDITVYITILGDSKHGDNGSVHGLAMGGLSTWVSSTKITAKTTNTVWDVLKPLLDEKGYSYSASDNNQYGSVYIASINGLAEFTNGPNSGWMYTFNGTHPNRGVSAYYLKDKAKIVLHYTDDYQYEEGGKYYGKTPGSEDGAKEVIDLIKKIGTVAYTDACKNRIDAARTAYDALTDAEKAKVTNFNTLESAEAKYEELKQAAQKANAEKVINLIKALPNPVTKTSKSAIDKARKAYDALTEEEKKLVTNLEVLTKAEVAYAKLTATKADLAKAQAVIDAINALPVSPDAKALEAVRKAYNKLTALQKLLVENYAALEAAEAKLSGEASLATAESRYKATGEYIQSLGTPSVGPIGGEWGVIGLTRSGLAVPGVEDYYRKALEYIQQSIDPATMRLHSAKSTDNSRMILALTAIGKDATDIDGYNLVMGLSDLDFVKYQGNNGPIWALIALDSGNYPASGTATRQALIAELLSVQTTDGGWTVSGSKADTDMTGMALQALAPYYETNEQVRSAVDKAIDKLSQMQQNDGSFCADYGDGNPVPTSESIAQVITALSALGIDPGTDPRFVKSGGSALDALLRYYVDGGGFRHLLDGERDGMATEQGYYALTAYFRFRSGEKRLYDMTDVLDKGGDPEEIPAQLPVTSKPTEEKTAEKKSVSPLLIVGISLMVLGVSAVIALVVIQKRVSKNNEE